MLWKGLASKKLRDLGDGFCLVLVCQHQAEGEIFQNGIYSVVAHLREIQEQPT